MTGISLDMNGRTFSHLLHPVSLRLQVQDWLKEDVPAFDYGGFVVGEQEETALLLCKSSGVLAGVPFFTAIFEELGCHVEWACEEGRYLKVKPGDRPYLIGRVTGKVRHLLLGERVALNCIARASGIASQAEHLRKIVNQQGWQGSIAGTRKTTPGFRLVEKYSLLVGGIDTHRHCLSDMIMLKDNHVWSAGNIAQAITDARLVGGFSTKIEVECRSLNDAVDAAQCGCDIVMLDNFDPKQLHGVARQLKEDFPNILIEASGGITEHNILQYTSPYIDIISLSKTTQGYETVDFSLKIFNSNSIIPNYQTINLFSSSTQSSSHKLYGSGGEGRDEMRMQDLVDDNQRDVKRENVQNFDYQSGADINDNGEIEQEQYDLGEDTTYYGEDDADGGDILDDVVDEQSMLSDAAYIRDQLPVDMALDYNMPVPRQARVDPLPIKSTRMSGANEWDENAILQAFKSDVLNLVQDETKSTEEMEQLLCPSVWKERVLTTQAVEGVDNTYQLVDVNSLDISPAFFLSPAHSQQAYSFIQIQKVLVARNMGKMVAKRKFLDENGIRKCRKILVVKQSLFAEIEISLVYRALRRDEPGRMQGLYHQQHQQSLPSSSSYGTVASNSGHATFGILATTSVGDGMILPTLQPKQEVKRRRTDLQPNDAEYSGMTEERTEDEKESANTL